MKKVFVTLWLLLCFLRPPTAAAGITAVSSEAEYNNFISRIVSLIALREELSGDVEKDKRIGESGRVIHEIDRIGTELDTLGVDWRSFLGPEKRGAGGAFFKNTFVRPAVQLANLHGHIRKLVGRTARARDVLPDGELLDSAFFINRDIDSFFPSDIAGIDSRNRPGDRVTPIEREIGEHATRFYCEDEEGRCFLLRFYPPGMDEMATGAAVIGSTIARLMGYNVPVSTIITVKGTGDSRFDGRRAVATEVVPGEGGPWSYYSFRDRREIRATKVLAAWINNNGLVDHNTLISSFRVGNVKLYRYYINNFDSSLGSAGARAKLPRDGWEHRLDMGVIASTPLRLILKPFGLWRERYKRTDKPIDTVVGLFDSNINPDLYEAEYPNMAWHCMTTGDALWAVNLISRFTPEQIEAVVALARYSDPGDAEYIKNILLERQRKIIEHYLRKRVK